MARKHSRFCLFTFLAIVPLAAQAKPWWLRGSDASENDFLPPDVAFRMGATLVDGDMLRLRWVIADGYYIYKQKIDVKAESPDLAVGVPQMPRGVAKTDAYLGRQEIFTQQVEALVPYSRNDFGAHPIEIKVTYQGCAEAGLCYPPIEKVVFLGAAAPGRQGGASASPPSTGGKPHAWQLLAMLAGVLGFLVAGFALRRGRSLGSPP